MIKKNYKKYFILSLIFYLECAEEQNKNFLIVCTTSIISDTVSNITKDKAVLVTIIARGVDPHAYNATYENLKAIEKADIVFYNGLHLEGKMHEIFNKNHKTTRTHYAVSDVLDENSLIVDKQFKEAGRDPHIWFDVKIWKQCVIYICNVICTEDPANKEFYKINLKAYLKKLDVLNEQITLAINTIHPSKRLLITSHDAFSYYAKAYNLKILALQGISTIAECGLRDIANMTQAIIENHINTIFLENTVPQTSMLAVIEGCKKKGWDVKIGGNLYSDALGELNSKAGTYIGMLEENTKIIVQGLK